jgi:hypothetical protein
LLSYGVDQLDNLRRAATYVDRILRGEKPGDLPVQRAMPVVGLMNLGSREASSDNAAAFRKGLSESGYIEGQNVTVEYHWLDGQPNRVPGWVKSHCPPLWVSCTGCSRTQPWLLGGGGDGPYRGKRYA